MQSVEALQSLQPREMDPDAPIPIAKVDSQITDSLKSWDAGVEKKPPLPPRLQGRFHHAEIEDVDEEVVLCVVDALGFIADLPASLQQGKARPMSLAAHRRTDQVCLCMASAWRESDAVDAIPQLRWKV